MDQSIIKSLTSLVFVVLNTFTVYILLILGVNKIGGRLRSQVGFGELLIVALLGSSVETSLIAGDVSLIAGLVSLTTLLLTNRLLTQLIRRYPRLRQIILGQPIVLFIRGKLILRHLQNVGMDEDDLLEGMRLHGYERLDQVKMVILEIDGSMSVIPKDRK